MQFESLISACSALPFVSASCCNTIQQEATLRPVLHSVTGVAVAQFSQGRLWFTRQSGVKILVKKLQASHRVIEKAPKWTCYNNFSPGNFCIVCPSYAAECYNVPQRHAPRLGGRAGLMACLMRGMSFGRPQIQTDPDFTWQQVESSVWEHLPQLKLARAIGRMISWEDSGHWKLSLWTGTTQGLTHGTMPPWPCVVGCPWQRSGSIYHRPASSR